MKASVSIFIIGPFRVAFALFLLFSSTITISGQFDLGNFINYRIENGLPDDRIYSIEQDQDRILWVGTALGLALFDGENFYTPFLQDNGLNIAHATVFGITNDPKGRIWISNEIGIFRFEKKEKKITKVYQLQNDENWCSKIIWRGNRGYFLLPNSLAIIQPDLKVELLKLDHENKIFYGLNALTFDKKGKLWFTANYALWSYLPEKEILEKKAGIAFDQLEIWSITQATDQSILIGTRSDGLFYLDDQENLISRGATGQYIRSLYCDKDLIWAGGGNKGLLVIPNFPDKTDSVQIPSSYPGSWTNCFYRDTFQNIFWLGTHQGLLQVTNEKTSIQTKDFEINDEGYPPYFLNFIEDRFKPDSLWIKIIDQGLGLWVHSSQTFKIFKPEIPFGKSHNVIIQDSIGRLWCTTYELPSIKIFDPRTESWHYPELKDQWQNVSWLFCDHEEKIWIGTEEGNLGKIEHLEGNSITIENIPIPDSLRSGIFGIAESSDHCLWILGEKHLIRYDRIDKELSPVHSLETEESAFDFLCLDIDKQDFIWLGGLKGIWQMNKEGAILNKYESLHTESLNSVYKIQSDTRGMVWVGTTTGLLRIDPSRDHIRKITPKDGLFAAAAYFISTQPSGNIYIGFPNVMQTIDTRTFAIDTFRPSLQIMDFKVMDRSIPVRLDQETVIEPSENYFTIYYAAINYRQSELNKYKYRLTGFETNWHQVEGTNVASYSNLPAGSYVFELQGSNNDDVWSNPTALARIKVRAPFYYQGWFIMIWGLVFAGLFYFYWNIKKQEKKRIKKLRIQIARDLHDEIGSSLSSIAFLSEFVRQKINLPNSDIDPVMKKIGTTTGNISDAMSGIIWTLQDEKPEFSHIIQRLRSFASRLTESQNSSLKIEIDPEMNTMNFSALQLKHLYLIVKEALNNATKYAGQCDINLAFLKENNKLHVIIKDSGKGCNLEEIELGNGLKNIRERVKEMGGYCSFESKPGKGFKVDIFL